MSLTGRFLRWCITVPDPLVAIPKAVNQVWPVVADDQADTDPARCLWNWCVGCENLRATCDWTDEGQYLCALCRQAGVDDASGHGIGAAGDTHYVAG